MQEEEEDEFNSYTEKTPICGKNNNTNNTYVSNSKFMRRQKSSSMNEIKDYFD
jgi:hypothetical protein